MFYVSQDGANTILLFTHLGKHFFLERLCNMLYKRFSKECKGPTALFKFFFISFKFLTKINFYRKLLTFRLKWSNYSLLFIFKKFFSGLVIL